MLIEITREGTFARFEDNLMRSQHLDAGAQVDYPDWYARSLIESGWAMTCEKAEMSAEESPEPTAPQVVRIDTAHPFFEIGGIGVRQVNALLAAGLQTLDDLGAATEEALLAIDGVGPATVARIRRYLRIRQ